MSLDTVSILAGLDPVKLRLRTAATIQAVSDGTRALEFFEKHTPPKNVDHRLARGVIVVFLTKEIDRLTALRDRLAPAGDEEKEDRA